MWFSFPISDDFYDSLCKIAHEEGFTTERGKPDCIGNYFMEEVTWSEVKFSPDVELRFLHCPTWSHIRSIDETLIDDQEVKIYHRSLPARYFFRIIELGESYLNDKYYIEWRPNSRGYPLSYEAFHLNDTTLILRCFRSWLRLMLIELLCEGCKISNEEEQVLIKMAKQKGIEVRTVDSNNCGTNLTFNPTSVFYEQSYFSISDRQEVDRKFFRYAIDYFAHAYYGYESYIEARETFAGVINSFNEWLSKMESFNNEPKYQ